MHMHIGMCTRDTQSSISARAGPHTPDHEGLEVVVAVFAVAAMASNTPRLLFLPRRQASPRTRGGHEAGGWERAKGKTPPAVAMRPCSYRSQCAG